MRPHPIYRKVLHMRNTNRIAAPAYTLGTLLLLQAAGVAYTLIQSF